jgi:hypothetical protein
MKLSTGAHPDNRAARPCTRIVAIAAMAIEPVVLVALLIVIVAATFSLTGYSPHARAVLAAVVPLELAIACWLLSVRLERRARTQEYALIEAFLGLNGNLAHEQWAWQVVLHERATSLLMVGGVPGREFGRQGLVECSRQHYGGGIRPVAAGVERARSGHEPHVSTGRAALCPARRSHPPRPDANLGSAFSCLPLERLGVSGAAHTRAELASVDTFRDTIDAGWNLVMHAGRQHDPGTLGAQSLATTGLAPDTLGSAVSSGTG